MVALVLSTSVAVTRTIRLSRSSARAGVDAAAAPARRGPLAVRAFKDDEVKTAVSDATSAVESKLAEFTELAQKKWEESDNKPGIIAVGAGSLLALYFTNSIVSTIDRIPVFSTLFELLGLAVTAWVAYSWIAVPGTKDSIIKTFTDAADKVGIEL